jgi:uncharacterized damage-inducible protein DinB
LEVYAEMSKALAELYKQNLWANLRLLDACKELSEEQLDGSVPGTYGSLRDTWVHLVAAESRYVSTLTGTQRDESFREGNPFPGLDELEKRARKSGEALVEIAEGFRPTRVLKGTWRGQPFTMRAIIPLMQVINHATEHRAHIMTIMTQQGVQPPEIDVWAYDDQS